MAIPGKEGLGSQQSAHFGNETGIYNRQTNQKEAESPPSLLFNSSLVFARIPNRI